MQWWQTLRGRPFYRVLDGSDPAASYYMLRHVVERPDSARALKAARLALQESEGVLALKAALEGATTEQVVSGHGWFRAFSVLAEWEHPGDDETIATALDYALEMSSRIEHPYVDVLLLHCARAFGFGADERARELEQGVIAGLDQERGSDPVYVALAARAFAADSETLPQNARSGLERSLSLLSPAHLPEFKEYAAPTFDTPDGLTIAESALRLGLRGTWLTPWVEQVVEAQNEEGFWCAGRGHFPGVEAGTPNHWLSAKALYVLRAYYGE